MGCSMVWYDIVCGVVWHGRVWQGMVWYDMIWCGVWYGMVKHFCDVKYFCVFLHSFLIGVWKEWPLEESCLAQNVMEET